MPTPNAPYRTPFQLLERVQDWTGYVAALEQCDRWWSHRREWSVLGDHCSWRVTVRDLHEVAAHEDWRELSCGDRRNLIGLTRNDCWALLGRMRGPARTAVFGPNQDEIQQTVHNAATAEANAFPQLAFESYERLWNLSGVGEGIATRLLTLARPDQFVSLNNASRHGLGNYFGLTPSTLGEPESYGSLLMAIYRQEWYRNPSPTNAYEESISRMRTALLDCFVYAHPNQT